MGEAGGFGAAARILLHTALATATLFALALLVFAAPYDKPTGDAPRYIVLGANLYQHGLISNRPFDADVAPAPALPVGGPLTAIELAAAMAVDPVTRQSFVCFLTAAECDFEFPGLRTFHVVELALFLAALWWIGFRLTGRAGVAWVAVGTALACKDFTFDARFVLTEPLSLAAIGGFLVCWLAVWEKPTHLTRAAALGLALAAIILVKPVFQALIPLTIALFAATVLLRGRTVAFRDVLPSAAVFLAACLGTLAPFYVYFYLCCGTASLADPSLLEAALSHRVAYNAMSVREWLAGWVYYLPDFGDNLAPALFPDLTPFKLGWDANSYYVHGRDVLHAQARAITAPEPATGYLIWTYVLSDPLWHAATSALLFWRGLFVGKLWGLVALFFLIAYPLIPKAPNRLEFLVVLLPILAIAGLQSGISVSIPRYNLALILPMSIAFAWMVTAAYAWMRKNRRHFASPLKPSD